MPKATKMPGEAAPVAGDLPFEEAVAKLESIVSAMESEDLSLEVLLARYEEGVKLVEVCRNRLSAAELRIQQLEKKADGTFQIKPLEDGHSAGSDETNRT